MAENLATKFEKKMETAYSINSILNGKVSEAHSFEGVRSINVYSPVLVELNDYSRTGNTDRYGTAEEMETAVQQMELSQDKSFTAILDKGNYTDRQMAISADNWLQEEVKQIVTPTIERYAFGKYVEFAGKVEGITAKPTKSTIMEAILTGSNYLDDNFVPPDGRYLYVTSEMLKLVKLSPEWVGVEALAKVALSKGVVGEIDGMMVVKVPTSYLPENCYFLIARSEAIMRPKKLQTLKIHKEPPGIDGWKMEGRFYYDAFVVGAKAHAVYAAVLSTSKQATPSLSSGALTSTGATKIWYTADGTDPRYSTSRVQISTGGAITGLDAGTYTIKAVAFKDGGFTSDVLETEYTAS